MKNRDRHYFGKRVPVPIFPGWAFLVFLAITVSASVSALGATIEGRDCGGQDIRCDGNPAPGLVCGGPDTCSNEDELQGTFTNVRLFVIGGGTRIFVAGNTPLAVYASTISIQGVLNGVGRGSSPGNLGELGSPGTAGSGPGGGGGGAAAHGGGGGGYGGTGGAGVCVSACNASPGGGFAGAINGGSLAPPVSPDDIARGSGGGGGGGGALGSAGTGGAGGGSVYLEASSVTVAGAGSILVTGTKGADATNDQGAGTNPGAGGGGSGGGILIRCPGIISLTGTGGLKANGGNGGNVSTLFGGTVRPGGGGAGGRIRIYSRSAPSSFTLELSTSIGFVGGSLSGVLDTSGTVNNGSSGTVTFGLLASSPIAPSVSATGVFITSVTWQWTLAAVWGDAPSGSQQFRIYASSSTPLPSASTGAAAGDISQIEAGLTPNTTYTRFVTAFTDWGDSLPSALVSTHTRANTPAPAVSTFTEVTTSGLTFNWASGGNPSYTEYQVWRALDESFIAGLATNFVVGLSSSPVGLQAEATYYFRVRARNLDGVPSAFSPISFQATSITPPTVPGAPQPSSAFSYDGNAAFSWTASQASAGIQQYHLEVCTSPSGTGVCPGESPSCRCFFVGPPVAVSTTVAGLDSGKTYYARVRAKSNADILSSFSEFGPGVSVFITATESAIVQPKSWPNPFNPSQGPANIGFELSAPATVTLKIFTLQGELVHEEIRRVEASGNQVWLWPGTNDLNRRVAPGGYVCLLEKKYDGRVETQKFKIAILY